jgi:hypothetical protein
LDRTDLGLVPVRLEPEVAQLGHHALHHFVAVRPREVLSPGGLGLKPRTLGASREGRRGPGP